MTKHVTKCVAEKKKLVRVLCSARIVEDGLGVEDARKCTVTEAEHKSTEMVATSKELQ